MRLVCDCVRTKHRDFTPGRGEVVLHSVSPSLGTRLPTLCVWESGTET